MLVYSRSFFQYICIREAHYLLESANHANYWHFFRANSSQNEFSSMPRNYNSQLLAKKPLKYQIEPYHTSRSYKARNLIVWDFNFGFLVKDVCNSSKTSSADDRYFGSSKSFWILCFNNISGSFGFFESLSHCVLFVLLNKNIKKLESVCTFEIKALVLNTQEYHLHTKFKLHYIDCHY